MSENKESSTQPTMKAGDPIIDFCPICKMGFQEKVETNKKHTCPNPECQISFCVIVYE